MNTNTEDITQTVKEFVRWVKPQLGLQDHPVNIRLVKTKPNQGTQFSFASFDPNSEQIVVACEGRHILDILRSLAHELVHLHQKLLDQLTDSSGLTGSAQENQANALAGVIMRNWNNRPNKNELLEKTYKLPIENEYYNIPYVKVIENPSKQQLQSFSRARGLIIPDRLYIWDAKEATHDDVADALGIESWIAVLITGENILYRGDRELSHEIAKNRQIMKLFRSPNIILDTDEWNLI